ncbi:MAG: ATP-binding protein, partial [Pseudonocardia sp.]|nr:ATP-binding protein [Pseudonocardia sp.]
MPEPVGRVVGTEDSTPLEWSVALAPQQYLQLDDVVVAERDVPGFGRVRTSGLVTQVTARHEGATFGSDVFLIADGVLPAHVQEIAEITTTRVEPECYVPPTPGAAVRRAIGEERAEALYFDGMERKVPVGMGRDGEPVYVDLEFLDGTRGGHVSISGVSGVATKTSFALFLLYGLFRSGVLGNRAVNAKALVFSVKGEDLLFLDHANTRLAGNDGESLRADYARLGLPAEPFASAGFFAPPRPDDLAGRPHVAGRTSGVAAFWWTLAEFCTGELLPYAFADAEDERNQYTMVIHQVAARLRREAMAIGDGAVQIDGRVLRTYDDLVEFVSDQLLDEDTRRDWAGPVTGTGTVNAFLRRLRSSAKPLRTIVRGDLPDLPARRVTTEGRQVTVVDLHNLPERAQRFVVGVVLASETARKEAAGTAGLLFTMIDELNKYAPREGASPIKEVLLDIAERGRSLGIILIGAQQTASEVERRIVSNSSVKVVGRLDPAEAGRPEYGFLPPAQRARA